MIIFKFIVVSFLLMFLGGIIGVSVMAQIATNNLKEDQKQLVTITEMSYKTGCIEAFKSINIFYDINGDINEACGSAAEIYSEPIKKLAEQE